MKKFGAYLSLIAMLSQSSALAWVGGPYGNNTYDGLDGGIFSGTIRGPSASGIFKFSQNNNGSEAYVSPFGDAIVYHRGMAYYGECYGFVDFDSKTVSGVTNGSNNGTNTNDPNSSPQARNLYGQGFGVQNGTGAGIASQNVFGAGNAAVANSYWNGKITKSKQTVRFEARGEMTMFGNATEVTTFDRVTSTGDFNDPRFDGADPLKPTEGDGTGLSLTGTSTPPGTGTTFRVTGNSNNYPNVTRVIKIRVYGSRVSVAPFAGPLAYAG